MDSPGLARQESVRRTALGRRSGKPVYCRPSRPVQAFGIVLRHSAQRDNGRLGLARQHPETHRPQWLRSGMRPGREYRRQQYCISICAVGSHNFLPVMRSGQFQQARIACQPRSRSVNAVRAPFLGGNCTTRQDAEMASALRDRLKPGEARAAFSRVQMVMPIYKARTAR